AAPRLAAHAHALADLEGLLVRRVEVQEAQHQVLVAVVDAHDELAARPELHLAVGHDALDLRVDAVAQRRDRHEARLVLLAQRQVQREVDVADEAEPFQRLLRRGFRLRGGLDHGAGFSPQRAWKNGGRITGRSSLMPHAYTLTDFDYALPPE